MKHLNKWVNKASQPNTIRDFCFLIFIVFFVINTLPVSVMGNENIARFFFAEREIKVLTQKDDCLGASLPCEIKLNESSQLRVTMPAQVSISEGFDVFAQISGVNVKRVSVMFKGVDHSHGLLPQPMQEVKPQNFQVKGLLSYCGYERMDWLALVTVYTERTIYEASFAFESVDTQNNTPDEGTPTAKSLVQEPHDNA